ncbi:hypothetical protein J8I29_29460 [Labrys sp. LIt4]|uniref:hypothetical protein n=1 Tax=Labrys sp. LIt4 TaxID=2821355 RepID=UPI001AE0AAD7|nr:hypothetical protein [Labrys sp. LIt4]MBP0583483.1 hypothetical protein [Labrys sp. LIt4]
MSQSSRPELPEAVKDSLNKAFVNYHEEKNRNNFEGMEKALLESWDLLPDQKLRWNFYSNIIPKFMVGFYRDFHHFDNAVRWLNIIRESYGPELNEPVEFLAATLDYEMGKLDKAFNEFDIQYKKYGSKVFSEYDNKYFKFYRDYRK